MSETITDSGRCGRVARAHSTSARAKGAAVEGAGHQVARRQVFEFFAQAFVGEQDEADREAEDAE